MQISKESMTQTVDGKVTREAKEEKNARGKHFWWKKADDPDEMAREIAGTIQFLSKHQSTRMDQLTASTRLYGNNANYNLLGAAFTRASATTNAPTSTRISFNVVGSIVDTLTAQIAKNKVVPTFITSGGIWGMQRKAELLTKFSEGLFYEQDAHEKTTYQFRDAGVWGDGIIHVYRTEHDRVGWERVLPHELLVDIVESIVTVPRQLHRVKVADRAVLLECYPDAEELIMEASPASYLDLGGTGTAADLVVVAQSWHLKSGSKAKDGICVMSLPESGKTISSEEYDKDYFPFAILPYNKRQLGFWGQGVAERTQNIQGEINRNMIVIQKSLWLQGGPKIFISNTSKIVQQHLNNDLGTLITGNEPPIYLTPPAVQPEIYTWVDSLIQKAYQQEGVSQLAASNVKPLGVDSGTALRTYDQIAEDRNLFVGQRCENNTLELLRQSIEVVKDIHKEKGTYKVNYPNTNFIEEIDWSDINLKGDEYWLKAFPTSELPEEPVAKLQTVKEYAQAGVISPRAMRRLLAMPDVEMADKLANAAEELICKTIEDILYDGDDSVVPDQEWDLVLAKDYCLKYLNYAKLNNCPNSRLEMLRDFMSQIDDDLGLTQPPPPPPMPVQPMANPQPTPTSDLIPNVNTPGAAA